MPKVDIVLCGRSYPVNCEPGSEQRLLQLAEYVNQKMSQMAERTVSATESRLLMLTALVLADEVFDLKSSEKTAEKSPRGAGAAKVAAEEEVLVAAVEELTHRLARITDIIKAA